MSEGSKSKVKCNNSHFKSSEKGNMIKREDTDNCAMHTLGNTSVSMVSWNNIFKRIILILNTVLPQDQFLFVPRHVETIKNIFSPSPCKKFSLKGLKNWQKAFCKKSGNTPYCKIITLPQNVHTDIGNLKKPNKRKKYLKQGPFLVNTMTTLPLILERDNIKQNFPA